MTGARRFESVVTGDRVRRRDPSTRRRVLEATISELEASGYLALTIDQVAARAGAGKATVYRWWPDKATLVIDALAERAQIDVAPDTGDVQGDVLALVRDAIVNFTNPIYSSTFGALLVEAPRQPRMLELYREKFLAPRRQAVRTVVERAISRGQLDPNFDDNLLLEVIVGTTMMRVLLSGEEIPHDLDQRIAAIALSSAQAQEPPTETRS